MSIIYILIPIAIILTSIAIYLFFWAVKTEQFEDLEKQGMSILFDNKEKTHETELSAIDNKTVNQVTHHEHRNNK
ncbi:MAG: cbb3-type cytochrome oxidase maturation protein [Colwellia sp.]|jgi:cbb3-type cytochrome oxidase maturation protein